MELSQINKTLSLKTGTGKLHANYLNIGTKKFIFVFVSHNSQMLANLVLIVRFKHKRYVNDHR